MKLPSEAQKQMLPVLILLLKSLGDLLVISAVVEYTCCIFFLQLTTNLPVGLLKGFGRSMYIRLAEVVK